MSRLDLIAAQGYEFRYGYLPHSTSDLVKTLRALFVKETEFTYEPGRDAIASVTNRIGFNHDRLLSQYGYAINADGQRISRTTTHGGHTFTDAFGFDPDTGGLTTSKRAAAPDDANNHTYSWDKIGNREGAISGAKTPITYQPNALNQYVRIESDSTLTPTHDADGNLTRRGDRTFTWDAEHRLITIHERGILIARYTYDHQSRRIARWTRDGVDERYLYQGWNLIAVYHPGETAPAETYTWGKDLSGSIQGAGGVGGLLLAKKRGHDHNAWIYHSDANGNVTEVTDSKGNLLDHYEYDPFGNLTNPRLLPANRFRFSTKLQDAETGFYYYGKRYYDPETGRWLSRDPIGEKGGFNPYRFVGNNPVNLFDPYGLKSWKDRDPLNIAMLGAKFFGLGFDGTKIIDVGADESFRSLGYRAAMKYIEKYFDMNDNGKLDEKDCPPFKLNITGYSWGAWTALQIAHVYHHNHKGKFEIRMGLVDPVATLRHKRTCLEWGIRLSTLGGWEDICVKWAQTATKPGNVVYGINYYQTMGGAGTIADGAFVGSSLPGMDVNTKLDESHDFREGFAHVDIMDTPQAKAIAGQIFE